ncbi:MAG: hypothetical protein WAN12_11460 [Candidatus Acidiferrum sp.]
MPNTIHTATWDFSPGDTVTLSASFTFDLNDPSDGQNVASVLTALQGRTPQVTLAQTDSVTITVTVTI